MSLLPRLKHALAYRLAGRAALYATRLSDERRLRSRLSPANDPRGPMLVSTARMKELMSRHYLEGRYAEGVRKVAWVTSGAPVEALRTLGYHLVYPENHAALCGARRVAEDLCTEAEAAGWSRDICSYARTDIGALLSGRTPVGRLPRPDLLVCCTNICQTVLYWYRVLAAETGAPLYLIDTPFLYREAQPHQLDYVQRQIEGLIPVAEEVAGRTLSWSRLLDFMRRSKESVELWLEVCRRNRHRPAPMTAFDGFVNMGPIVDLRGEPETLDLYRALLSELDDRVAAGVGAIKDERRRVLWDNLPIWFRLGGLSKLLASRGVNVVVSTYTWAWAELAPLMDPDRPMESAARVYLHALLNRSTGSKLNHMRSLIEDFACDGAILHSDRSCKPYSLGQLDQRDRLAEAGVPALLLEADHNDPRSWSDEQGTARLEAFMEMLGV